MAVIPSPLTGRTFSGRYAVERELGRGGTAVVYLARDLAHARMVAIKTLRPELLESLSAERFLREIRLTAALHHPHIVPLLDSGESEGVLYCVMPFMDGGTFRDRLREEKQLPQADVISVGRTVANALHSAHVKGLIHRDVKPENILFTGGEPCLGDFGIARALVRGTGDQTTSTGIIRGTPAYMSPEQAGGEHNYDGRSDIYSLGCVLYEAIAGVPAFIGPTSQSILAQRMLHPPRPLNVYRPRVSPELAEVIERAMMVAPADRYQTAAQLEAALEAAEPSLAKTVSLSARVPVELSVLTTRRRRWWTVGAAAVALAAVGLGSVVLPSLRGGSAPAVDENSLVIAPFNILDPADTLWRIGLVDVFARSFDGAGPLRTVPPSVSMRAWKAARSDVVTTTQLGRDTHAGLALFGQLLRAGSDTVRVTVSLIDLKRGRTFEIEARDELGRMDRLADSLTVRLLRELGSIRPIAAVPRASMGSRSLAALKSFLQGEQLYRANDVVAARDAYARAIAADTGFALAYRRMRGVWRAIAGQESDSTGFAYALLAGERNHGLAPRDSLLIVADSLAATKAPGVAFLDEISLGRLRRRVAALQAALWRYPDDPEVQFEFGEAAYHIGERVGLSQRQALDAFAESIRLDPAFLPSYYHAIELALPLEGVAPAVRLAKQYDGMSAHPSRYELFVRLVQARDERDLERLVVETDRAEFGAVDEAIELTRRWPDSLATAVRLSQRMLHRSGLSARDSEIAGIWLSNTLLFRGRLREARKALSSVLIARHPEWFLQLARLGAAPLDSAVQIGRQWAGRADDRGRYLGIPLLGMLRDSASLEKLVQYFQVQLSLNKSRASQSTALVGLGSAKARLALVRNDTAGAIKEFLAIPDSLCSWWCADDRLTTARLLEAKGRQREALTYLDRHPPSAGPTTIEEPLWILERSRAQRTANPAEADRNLRFVERAWLDADSTVRARLRIGSN